MTGLVKTRQLNSLRRRSEEMMPDQVTILVPGPLTPDGFGGTTRTFTDFAIVACRFRPNTQRTDSVQGGQPGTDELFQFSLPVGTVIDVNYRLRRNEVEYEVVGVPTDSSYQISTKVLAKRL